MTLGAFSHQPLQSFLELGDGFLALAALNISAFVQQGAQLSAKGDDSLVVIAAEEVAVEGDVVRQAVGDQFDLWQPRTPVPVGHGQTRRGWVVIACLGYSRAGAGVLVFSRRRSQVPGRGVGARRLDRR